MLKLHNNILIVIIGIAVILLAGCTNSLAATVASPSTQEMPQPAAQQAVSQSGTQAEQSSPQQKPVTGYASSDGSSSSEPAEVKDRVDVIYFHMNQRCVTCLCFEEHINSVMEKYFSSALASGKLTYRVFNAQSPQNAEIAHKYGAVGSQLFVNTITGGEDHIEDIANIWYWNCRNNPKGFDLNVKNTIEKQLQVLD